MNLSDKITELIDGHLPPLYENGISVGTNTSMHFRFKDSRKDEFFELFFVGLPPAFVT
jgi:hypothetical protein